METKEKLGTFLRQRRNSLGISQSELADRAGLDRTYVSMLERGLKYPTVLTLIKIGNVLNIKPSQILSEIDL